MNQYQLIKYAVIGLSTFSRLTATYATYSSDYRYEAARLASEKVKQTIIEYGNQAWQQELAHQTPASLESQETNEGVLVNAI